MYSRVSITSWREGVSLASSGHHSIDCVTIKIPYGVDVLLRQPASHSSSPTGLVTTESEALNRLRLT